jgi:uncharacterized oligopeptide transporter (OPT) family protein
MARAIALASRRVHDRRMTPAAPPDHAPAPELSPDATPEEKDQYWFQHVYQGDSMPQLTLRAVLIGGGIGMLMAISNLYTTLKLGWSFGVAITASVIAYALWNGMRRVSGNRLSPMTLLESNCMQSTASAAGYSTGGTVGTAFGALLIITGQHQAWYVVAPFVLFTAALGVFIAIPMKRQMINHDQLPFPTGTAAAETLKSLYASGREAARKAWSLMVSLAVGGLVALLRTYATMIDALPPGHPWRLRLEHWKGILSIPEAIDLGRGPFPGMRGASLATFSFEPSLLLIGAGMIVGLRVSLSMLLGSCLLFFVVAPAWLYPGGPVTPAGATVVRPWAWGLWGGTAVMVFSSLTSLALQWKTLVRAFQLRRAPRSPAADQLRAIEVPMSWLVVGLIPISLGLVVVQWLAFQINPLLGVLAVAMSFVVSLVCCRSTGETDTTPIGPMGKVTQLLYAFLPGSAGNATINLMAAGATSAAGGSSADLLTDLKSGYLLGANPRRQFLAQFAGIFFGTLMIVPFWYLMVPTQEALDKFNPPATQMWVAVTRLLTAQNMALPAGAPTIIVLGALIGITLPLLEASFPKARSYIPSAMGLGLSWAMPFQNAFSFAIGAVVAWAWLKWHRRNQEEFCVPIASGFIAGEALVAALIAITCTILGLTVR